MELHDFRKDDERVSGFTPFYFSSMKEDFTTDKAYQTVYVDCKKQDFMDEVSNVTYPETIERLNIKDSVFIIEGKMSYLKLIEKGMPDYNYLNIVAFLKANQANFEILSIQTDEQIGPSIIPYSKYHKMIEELKAKSIIAEPVL